jgi:hypothetical protein
MGRVGGAAGIPLRVNAIPAADLHERQGCESLDQQLNRRKAPSTVDRLNDAMPCDCSPKPYALVVAASAAKKNCSHARFEIHRPALSAHLRATAETRPEKGRVRML